MKHNRLLSTLPFWENVIGPTAWLSSPRVHPFHVV